MSPITTGFWCIVNTILLHRPYQLPSGTTLSSVLTFQNGTQQFIFPTSLVWLLLLVVSALKPNTKLYKIDKQQGPTV